VKRLLWVLIPLLFLSGCNEEEVTKQMTNTKNPVVKMTTSEGDILIELFEKEAPITVENFLSYVDDKFYDGTIFHRVIDGFMLQGGGFEPDMEQKETSAPIKNEANNGLKNDRGYLSMARTMVVDSATSQFFLNVVDNDFLNYKGDNPQTYGYAVFAQVLEGMDVVDSIKGVKTGSVGGHQDVPVEPVVIVSVSLVKK
jgi:cyclophilin family peptidyl-prolyl cis-trans isomerase